MGGSSPIFADKLCNMLDSKIIQKQLEENGIVPEVIKAQIELLGRGKQHVNLDRAAAIGDGIQQFTEDEQRVYRQLFQALTPETRVQFFIPASGAASRMFKDMASSLDRKSLDEATKVYLENLDKFAFAEDLPEGINSEDEWGKLEKTLGQPMGLASLPKALIKFHSYREGGRFALGEHFYLATRLLGDYVEEITLHFTISPEHADDFRKAAEQMAIFYGDRFEQNFVLEYSEQSPATKTLATDLENNPVVLSSGELLLRPGGHGSLIHNLRACKSDVVFIKNIDNVIPESKSDDSLVWKEILGGKLMDVRKQVYYYLDELENGKRPESLGNFLRNEFNAEVPESDEDLYQFLHRPIRVCGMVKNEGEPGGGPFWVNSNNESTSLQIVEKAQIDVDDPDQKSILESATHFNPVDLVVSLRDHKGLKFDLLGLIDPNTFFISQKSHDGRPIKALEHPGLWNGAMADWLTIFVEVPIATFNPVKSVIDLLKPAHQPS